MINKPHISIITASKDDPVGLARTLRSLIDLRWAINLDVVVVDGSPAKNSPIVKGFEEALSVRVVRDQIQGIYPALNLGLASSRGDWIWFLNGGDRIGDPLVVADALGRAGQAQNKIIVLGTRVYRQHELHHLKVPAADLSGNLRGSLRASHQAVIVSSDLANSVGRFDEGLSVAGDYDYLLRCAAKQPIYVRDVRPAVAFELGGHSTKNPWVALKEARRVFLRHERSRLRRWHHGVFWLADLMALVARRTLIFVGVPERIRTRLSWWLSSATEAARSLIRRSA